MSQAAPYERTGVKPGMDTKQVIARFKAERQALALLDHPNIAHVFNTGRPCFAIEYVTASLSASMAIGTS